VFNEIRSVEPNGGSRYIETLAQFYKTVGYMPEDKNCHNQIREELKSQKVISVFVKVNSLGQ
jgi:hypothetical protein